MFGKQTVCAMSSRKILNRHRWKINTRIQTLKNWSYGGKCWSISGFSKGSEDRGHRLGTLGTLLAIPDRTNSCFVIVPAVQAQCQAANGFEGLIFIIYTLLTKHRSQGPDSRSQGVHREDFSSWRVWEARPNHSYPNCWEMTSLKKV